MKKKITTLACDICDSLYPNQHGITNYNKIVEDAITFAGWYKITRYEEVTVVCSEKCLRKYLRNSSANESRVNDNNGNTSNS